MKLYLNFVPYTFIIMALLFTVHSVSSIEAGENAGQIFKPNDKQLVEAGKAIYADNCASCHGANLEGQTPNWRSPGPDGKLPAPPHDQTGHTWHHTDKLLFNLTKYGLKKAAGLKNYESNMPIYEDTLTDEEIIAVLSYIKSTWPKEIIEHHDQMNAAKAGANNVCSCHKANTKQINRHASSEYFIKPQAYAIERIHDA